MNVQSKCQKGFTLTEVLIIVAIVAGMLAIGSIVYLSTTATINGSFSVAPARIPAGGSAQFTYHVSKTSFGRTSPESGRTINFRIAPSDLTITPTSAATDGFGNIVLTVSSPIVEYVYGGNIWATDVTSGLEDNPIHVSVR